MATKIISLICFDFISDIESIDLFHILPIALSQSPQLVIWLSLLRLQIGVGVLRNLVLVAHTLDVYIAIWDKLSLPIQFSVQLSILTFAIVVNCALLIDLAS